MTEREDEQLRQVLTYYEGQTEDEAAAEDEAAFADPSQVVMVIPRELVPIVRALIARYEGLKVNKKSTAGSKRENRKRVARGRNSIKAKTNKNKRA